MELAPTSPQTQVAHPVAKGLLSLDSIEAVKMEECKEMEIKNRLEEEEEDAPPERLTSSRLGNASAIESSQMFTSLLAEGSSIRYDSGMQVRDRKRISNVTFNITVSVFNLVLFILKMNCLCAFRWIAAITLHQQALLASLMALAQTVRPKRLTVLTWWKKGSPFLDPKLK